LEKEFSTAYIMVSFFFRLASRLHDRQDNKIEDRQNEHRESRPILCFRVNVKKQKTPPTPARLDTILPKLYMRK
jgi:hypothetical protein